MATDFAPVPAVFMRHQDGEALKELFRTNETAVAQIRLASTRHVFTVTDSMVCEQVGLRIMTDHQRRGDLRITLVSPAGTRSVLQRYGFDTAPGPTDWTSFFTHHFYESSIGDWTAYVSDQATGSTGSVLSASLVLRGVRIPDSDVDGLDDSWERIHFGGLQAGPTEDPDRDGRSSSREQILNSDPLAPGHLPLDLNLSPWTKIIGRLSWPSSPWDSYEVWGGTNTQSLLLITNVPGRFPETEWFYTVL